MRALSVPPLLKRPLRYCRPFLLLLPWSISPVYAQLHDMGVLPGGTESTGSAISGDGRVVGASGTDGLGQQWLFYWAADGSVVKIASSAGVPVIRAINYDGSVMAGVLRINGSMRAFRWDAATGISELGTFGGTNSGVWDISNDGRVIVGEAADATTLRHAFRWTAQNGLEKLGGLSATGTSVAFAVSGDGVVTVGTALNSSGVLRAVRWENGAILDLGTLPAGGSASALGVNADGSVVVGSSGFEAFRWTAGTGMVDIGGLGGLYSLAEDVSADGSVIAGTAALPDGTERAFRWTAETGVVNLGVLNGGTYSLANAISDDGNVIVGTANNAHGDRAFIWKQSVLQDLGNVQGSVAGSADTSAQLLYGQFRRARALNEQRCLPGDLQPYCLSVGGGLRMGEPVERGRHAVGVLGAGVRLNEWFSLGANLASGKASRLPDAARQSHELGVGAWLTYQQDAHALTGWSATLSVATQGADSQFVRGDRADNVEQASTGVDTRANAQRVAVSHGLRLGATLVTPELAITHVTGLRDGFVERNVVLPLRVQGARSDETLATVALRSETPLSERASLEVGVALDIQLSEREADFTGQSDIPSLGRFTLRSQLERRSLTPSATAGYRYALNQNASLGGQAQVGAAPFEGQRPVLGLFVDYRYRF